MLEDELKAYIIDSLENGIKLDAIKNALLNAGHNIGRIESATHKAFQHLDQDIIEYFEIELKKGYSFEKIRQDLISLGHHHGRVERVIHHLQTRKITKIPWTHELAEYIDDTVHTRKFWISSSIFIIIFTLLMIFYIVSTSPAKLSIDEIQKVHNACLELNVQTGNPIVDSFEETCLSLLYHDSAYCNVVQGEEAQICKIGFALFSALKTSQSKYCRELEGSERDFCMLLIRKGSAEACDSVKNDKLFYPICRAVRLNDKEQCPSSNNACQYIYYIILSEKKQSVEPCSLISDPLVSSFCKLNFLI